MNRRGFLKAAAGAIAGTAVAPAAVKAFETPWEPLRYTHKTFGLGFKISKDLVHVSEMGRWPSMLYVSSDCEMFANAEYYPGKVIAVDDPLRAFLSPAPEGP